MESKQHSSSRDGGNIGAVRTRSNIIFQKNRRSRHTNALHLRRAAPRRRATGLGRLRRRSEAGSRAVAGERPRRARGAGRQSGADPDREAEQGAAEVAELLVAGSRRAAGDSPEPKALPQRRGHRRRTFRAPRDAGTHRSSQRGRRGRKERCGRSAARHRVEVREALRRGVRDSEVDNRIFLLPSLCRLIRFRRAGRDGLGARLLEALRVQVEKSDDGQSSKGSHFVTRSS